MPVNAARLKAHQIIDQSAPLGYVTVVEHWHRLPDGQVGLSASAIGRLKDGWLDEHTAWQKRDLSAKRYVYIWVDGIPLQARLEDEKRCPVSAGPRALLKRLREHLSSLLCDVLLMRPPSGEQRPFNPCQVAPRSRTPAAVGA